MSDAGLVLRLLDAVAQGGEKKGHLQGEVTTTPSFAQSSEMLVTSRQMLEALVATDFDLPSAIVRIARGD